MRPSTPPDCNLFPADSTPSSFGIEEEEAQCCSKRRDTVMNRYIKSELN